MRPDPFPWTDEHQEALRSLWACGFTAREIGRQLRASPNAVTAKARRMGLPRRPSPIGERHGQA